ncbi:SRPBCC family protein [Phaeacidiphilus oryzae]|uniref:SRPBCC family protein n=1 Tax=Phaeacidiphilus oryzae TaxID=348818 RepID=UPI000562FE33|nr:SRPBCC family protein [Phaeacidiphilus oryzae]
MELQQEFTVPVEVEEAWRALLDIESVAPCMPGTTVESYDGETIKGSVKVKVGPITLTYRGNAVFEERDEAARRVVLAADGRDSRGQGTARAKVTGVLTPSEKGDGTAVRVTVDLTVTGRPAQFGRGVIADVGDRLTSTFAQNLAERLRTPAPSQPPAAAEEETAAEERETAEPAPAPPAEAAPLDLGRAAALPVAKRLAVPLAVLAVGALLFRAIRRRRRAR